MYVSSTSTVPVSRSRPGRTSTERSRCSIAHAVAYEPISSDRCRVLTEHGCKIAPSTYYAARARAASARSISDGALLVEIKRVHSDPNIGRGLYGVAKVWH